MSERDGYPHGVPCWVDTWQPDAEAAAGFYSDLFGWDVQISGAEGDPLRYGMCRLDGAAVAGVGAPERHEAPAPSWTTYVRVDSAEAAAAAAVQSGGRVVTEPFDPLDGGRMTILEDPSGAVLAAWQAGAHRGAERVNEPGAWAMSILHTRDPEAAKRFYGAVFGWEPGAFGDGGPTLWRLPGFVGGEPEQPVPRDVVGVMVDISGGGIPDGIPPHWGVDFWVADADAVAARAGELGGRVIAPPVSHQMFRQTVLADPVGATFTASQLLAGATPSDAA